MATDALNRGFDYAAEQEDESSFAIFSLAWRRKWIMLLMILVGVGLGYLFYLQQTPIYQSMAQVHIVRDTSNGPIEELKVSSSYDTVHETLIRSPMVLSKAIPHLDINALPTLAGLWHDFSHVQDEQRRLQLEEQRDLSLTHAIMGNLQVEVGHNYSADILIMTYRSPYPAECPAILKAVAAAYQEHWKEIYEGQGEDTEDLIKQASGKLNDDLKQANDNYAKFRAEHKDQLLFLGEETQNIHAIKLDDIDQRLQRLQWDTNGMRQLVSGIRQALEEGTQREALTLVIEGPSLRAPPEEPPLDNDVERQLLPLRQNLDSLLRKFAADHPSVREAEHNLQLMRETLTRTAPIREEEPDHLETFLAAQEFKITQNEQQIRELEKQYEEEHKLATALSEAQTRGKSLRDEVVRLKDAYTEVTTKLADIEIVKGRTNTRVDLIYPPGNAYQVEPDLMTVMIAAGLMGMLAGLGLAFVIDRADRRFHSPDEIRSDLGIPVVGHIPVLPGIKQGKRRKREEVVTEGELSPALRTHHHPRGRIAEAYRAVRTALYFSTRGSGHQVIQVTSPSPGDGKSTLSGNLAISIANSGKRCLLIDADFRRPRIHRLFGLDNSTGISSVIEGKSEIVDAVQQTDVENLAIMSCGPRPDNPSELLSSLRFAELLELLREQYDLVVVDTPPVLAVTDPLNVVARVDGVILVLRLTKSARTMGRRALEALDGMGANVLGIVINGVGSEKGGYGYGYSYGKYGYGKSGYGGRYKYGYGSEYAYEYRYADGYGDDRIYYEDEPAAGGNGKLGAQKAKK